MMQSFKRQDGAVALLTAIIISLLLSIVLTGFIVVMVGEQRQATDSEQSVSAYYAAQSGVEDAIRKLKSPVNLRTDQICDGTGNTSNLNILPSASGQVGWSCQSITFSGQPTGKLQDPDSATQLDLSGATVSFDSLQLQWELASGKNYSSPIPDLDNADNWIKNRRPAAMEMTIIDFPNNKNFKASDINTQNILIVPGTGGGLADINSVISNPYVASCSDLGTYKCKMTLTGFGSGGRSYIVRIRSRYTGTDYQLTARNGAAIVDIPDGTATIDVTGKSGDVYRRVVYKVPFSKGVAKGLDYVLFSDNDICKNISIIGGAVTDNCP